MKHLTLIILGILFCLSSNAVSNDSIFLEGKVFDKLTHVQVPGCLVEILNGSDSTLVNSQIAQQTSVSSGKKSVHAIYEIKIPRLVGKYILRVSMAGYDTTYADLLINKIHERAWKIDTQPIYISRVKSVHLDDVVVKATKVKFYHKGDTLVYNADAFQLAEGSMLDALIRQLPGAELRKDGQIYVNGKFVDNLLLNGKDFFRGNHTVMLENLPNYMVSSINVYDKLGKNSKFAGYEMSDDRQYVMDVKLKKQYSIGWIGNIEGGGGTKDRYLGRLFAMRYTDHSRLAIYGNVNNLNDSRKPGENDSWSPSDLQGGLSEQQLGGIDYFIDDRNGKYTLDGNVQVNHQETTSITHTNRQNFLSSGDTYERMVNSNRNHELTFNTVHRLYFEGKYANLELVPKVNYRKYDNTVDYSSLALTKDFTLFGKKQLDSLFSMNLGKELLSFAINRNLQCGKFKGHVLKTSVSANSVIKFKNSPDILTLYADASYRDAKEERFDHNKVEYYNQGAKILSDFRNRYFDNVPNKGYHLTGKVTYTYPTGKWYTLYLSYKYERDYKSSHSFLYRLDQLDGWGEDSMEKLGSLPSMEAYQRMLDTPNSYHSRLYEDNHQLAPFLNWQVKGVKGIWSGQFRMPVAYKTRTLRYHRGEVDTTFTKRTILLSIYSTYANWKSNDKKKEFRIAYDVNSKAPDMNMYLNIRDTTDPLNITLGNLNLKNAYEHTVRSSLSRMYPKRQMLMVAEAEYSVSTNEIAMGYTYDTKTGIRTFCPDNVNGNWKGRINLGLITPLDKKKALVLQAVLGANYRRNVDFVGLNGNAASRSVVKTSGLQENVSLQWRLGKSSLSFKSKGDWGHTTSTRQDFQPFNAININNGLTAQVLLPWKFQLGTDLTLYSRRGYTDKEMNTDDFVWNARLSRSFFKGRILAMIDGFDILGQLNNITRIMNAQAITETYSNVIPRYVMFHISYKLKTMPKKNNKGMKVTVLMVVYNGEKYLVECVNSIINQTFSDFELLIIDDGSTDNSLGIIQDFKDWRVRVVRNKHDYIGSLNLGLKESRGEYIARMDVDDIMERYRLEEQIAILDAYPEVAACMCWAKTFGLVEKGLCRGNGIIRDALPELLCSNILIHSSAMLRKSFLLSHKIQYKDYPYAEDYKLWVDMSIVGACFWVVPKYLLKYRTSCEQVSAKHATEQEATAVRIKNEILLALLNDENNNIASLQNIYSIMEYMNAQGILSSNSIRMIMSILFKEIRVRK